MIHMHPSADGAAIGEGSLRDFRRLATVVSGLAGGVLINIGSAVVMPEVLLKAFAHVKEPRNPAGRLPGSRPGHGPELPRGHAGRRSDQAPGRPRHRAYRPSRDHAAALAGLVLAELEEGRAMSAAAGAMRLPSLKKGRRIPRLLTASGRMLPDFLIIGAQRGGTTSLYEYLVAHPSVGPAFKKEVHFFDLYYDKGLTWYRSNFPLVAQKRLPGARAGRSLPGGRSQPLLPLPPAGAGARPGGPARGPPDRGAPASRRPRVLALPVDGAQGEGVAFLRRRHRAGAGAAALRNGAGESATVTSPICPEGSTWSSSSAGWSCSPGSSCWS